MFLLNNTCEDASIPIFTRINEALERGEEVTCGELFRVAKVEIAFANLFTVFFEKSVSVVMDAKVGPGHNVSNKSLVVTHPPSLSEVAAHRWCRVFDAEGRCVNIDPTIEQFPVYNGPKNLSISLLDGVWDVTVGSTSHRKRKWIWMGTDLGNSGLPLFKAHFAGSEFVKKLSNDLKNNDACPEAARAIRAEIARVVKQM